jgi:LysM repeat protein
MDTAAQIVVLLTEIRQEMKYQNKLLEFIYQSVDSRELREEMRKRMFGEKLSALKEIAEAYRKGEKPTTELAQKIMQQAGDTISIITKETSDFGESMGFKDTEAKG